MRTYHGAFRISTFYGANTGGGSPHYGHRYGYRRRRGGVVGFIYCYLWFLIEIERPANNARINIKAHRKVATYRELRGDSWFGIAVLQ